MKTFILSINSIMSSFASAIQIGRCAHDCRYSRIYRVSFIHYLKGLIMSEFLSLIAVVAFWIACFALWAYGVAICWAANELFWAVVSFAFAPVGVLIGAYNFIF